MNSVFESGVSVQSAFQTLERSLSYLRICLLCVPSSSPVRKEFSDEVTSISKAVTQLSYRFYNSFEKEFL